MDDFEWVGSYADFIAQERPCGAAVRVADATMTPILYEADIVRVERRESTEDDVICVQIAGSHVFGYRSGNTLHRLTGPDLQLTGNEHIVGVVTAVIDRDLTTRRR